MRVKIREILEECIADGLRSGYQRAHKYYDQPCEEQLISYMDDHIWLEIDQWFDFERNVCNEVVEGFDYLEKEREWVGLTEVEIRYALREWAETNQTVREMLYAIEDTLKEKNT